MSPMPWEKSSASFGQRKNRPACMRPASMARLWNSSKKTDNAMVRGRACEVRRTNLVYVNIPSGPSPAPKRKEFWQKYYGQKNKAENPPCNTGIFHAFSFLFSSSFRPPFFCLNVVFSFDITPWSAVKLAKSATPTRIPDFFLPQSTEKKKEWTANCAN